jgi:hypothetical protein
VAAPPPRELPAAAADAPLLTALVEGIEVLTPDRAEVL